MCVSTSDIVLFCLRLDGIGAPSSKAIFLGQDMQSSGQSASGYIQDNISYQPTRLFFIWLCFSKIYIFFDLHLVELLLSSLVARVVGLLSDLKSLKGGILLRKYSIRPTYVVPMAVEEQILDSDTDQSEIVRFKIVRELCVQCPPARLAGSQH